MTRLLLFISVFVLLLLDSESLSPDKCQQPPKEKHCLIEYSVRYRWQHTIRYVYNWYTRSCFEIRWASYCHPVPAPTTSNNFQSEEECLAECAGWA